MFTKETDANCAGLQRNAVSCQLGEAKASRQEAEEKLAQEEAQQLADLEAQRLKLIDNVLLVTEKIDKLSEET